jgi:hypothetical protein
MQVFVTLVVAIWATFLLIAPEFLIISLFNTSITVSHLIGMLFVIFSVVSLYTSLKSKVDVRIFKTSLPILGGLFFSSLTHTLIYTIYSVDIEHNITTSIISFIALVLFSVLYIRDLISGNVNDSDKSFYDGKVPE